MDISLILKVAGVGVLVAIASSVLNKAGKDEQAMLVTLTGIVTVMLMLVRELGSLFDALRTTFGL